LEREQFPFHAHITTTQRHIEVDDEMMQIAVDMVQLCPLGKASEAPHFGLFLTAKRKITISLIIWESVRLNIAPF
jgi:hypothetical protein